VAALALGAALIALHAAARMSAESARAQGVEAFHDARARSHAEAPLETGRLAGDEPAGSQAPPRIDQSLWSPQRVHAFEQNRRERTDPPRALLRIPSLELEVPIYGDTGEVNLSRGAGHIEGTAALGATGNSGIAAHRDGFFRKLEHIDLGVDVLLDVGELTLRYRVSSVEIVLPTDVHVLAETANASITLVTCYPFYFLGAAPQRYIVRADAVDSRAAAAELPVEAGTHTNEAATRREHTWAFTRD
jgi:sortase A